MAVNRVMCYHKPRGRVWDLKDAEVSMQRRLGLSKFQNRRSQQKAGEAKLELTAGLKN